jgi:hypothetical protein
MKDPMSLRLGPLAGPLCRFTLLQSNLEIITLKTATHGQSKKLRSRKT